MKKEDKAEVVEDPTFIHRDEDGNETSYKINEMSDEDQRRVVHISNLQNKIRVQSFEYSETFSCLNAGLAAFQRDLVNSLQSNGKAKSEKVED